MRFLGLVAAIALMLALAPLRRELCGTSSRPHAQVGTRYATTTRVQPASMRARFVAVDIFIDSGQSPLAAYQVDFSATDDGPVKVVGVEGGDVGPFHAAPYYDERAIQSERVIIGALSTLPPDQLPRGSVRVARIHLMSSSATPTCTLTLTTAAGADAERIAATALWTLVQEDTIMRDSAHDNGTIERK